MLHRTSDNGLLAICVTAAAAVVLGLAGFVYLSNAAESKARSEAVAACLEAGHSDACGFVVCRAFGDSYVNCESARSR